MQHEPTTDKQMHTIKVNIKNDLQTPWSGLQSFSNPFEDQRIQNKMHLQLYLHFERMLAKSLQYNHASQFFNKKVSKQNIANETIKYLTQFEENIKPLPSQHNEQLLFLIDIFNKNDRLITGWFCIHSDYQDLTGSKKLYLGLDQIYPKIYLNQFLSFNNWNHLFSLSFRHCEWFSDNQWKALVDHADNFNNLKRLDLEGNNICEIQEGDIEQFKSLYLIDLKQNPLTGQTKQLLKRLRRKKYEMAIYFF